MAAKAESLKVYFRTDSPEERAVGIKILDRIIAENENTTMDIGEGGSGIRKKDKAKGPAVQEVPETPIDGHEPLLGEGSLGDEI